MNHRELIHHGKRIDLYKVQVPGSDGNAHERDFIEHPGAVVVLPLLDATPGSEQVVMIRNQRFAVGGELLELPAGTLEAEDLATLNAEDPESWPYRRAECELLEEAGYEADALMQLTCFYSCPGFCNEKLYAFLATDLTHVGQQLEANEQITVEVMPLTQVMELAADGTLQDGKTLATLLFYTSFIRSM